jgi:hypothetical protein
MYDNVSTLPRHCRRIMATASGNTQFSITLPDEAIEMIEKGLVPFGLYGKTRALIAANLILDMLKRREIREIVREHMHKPA